MNNQELRSVWHALGVHEAAGVPHLRQLFADDPERFTRFSVSACGLHLDASKNRVTSATVDLLCQLAESSGVSGKRNAMFTGQRINVTEDRTVRHVALRAPRNDPDFADVADQVHDVLDRFLAFADATRQGRVLSSDGQPLTDVINIGIGGSDLGPLLVTQALSPYHDGPRVHYVSNVDGAHIADTLAKLDPARTLVIVASKSFTTLETMTNAPTARRWIADKLGENAVADHFAAISTNLNAVREFGIEKDRVFGFWEWVGGRYSVWSAIGLPVAIAIGPERFRQFLAGANAMDRHFRTAPPRENLPVLLALVGIWNRNLLGMPTQAVLPYDQRLARFPAYLQQLDMESNGKSVCIDGSPVSCATAPVVWGEPGTNGQHAFFQMLHQGTEVVPCDFLIAANAHEGANMAEHHLQLAANCFAQSEALAFGQTLEEARAGLIAAGLSEAEADRLAPHKVFPGNRPSNTIIYEKLTPEIMGSLMALYEHKVFVQAAIWDINAFDQWGVELGKTLAKRLVPVLEGSAGSQNLDSSTAGLVATFRRLHGSCGA